MRDSLKECQNWAEQSDWRDCWLKSEHNNCLSQLFKRFQEIQFLIPDILPVGLLRLSAGIINISIWR
jgi:hypothetical protein